MPRDLAVRIVNESLKFLRTRKGFDNFLHGIDAEVLREFRHDWMARIREVLDDDDDQA